MKKEEDNKESGALESLLQSNVMMEFVNLISIIIDYYGERRNNDEDGENWKTGTAYSSNSVPKEVDEAVEKSFLTQLKKYS